MLRDYQQRAIDLLYEWFDKNDDGNPCLVLPTGSGKSHIVAALCKDAIQNWPDTRVLMLTHQKELIEQNAAKMREHWRGAPMGIYSASVGKRQLGEPITFAGIQSLIRRVDDVGHVDVCLIDECHLVSHEDEGSYRVLLRSLRGINPSMRIVGLTATPYRLGHGLITDPPAIFSDLIEPVSIEELVYQGHLAPLRSKVTRTRLDVSGVHKRGGEYIERELQAAVDVDETNDAVVREVIALAGERKSWLFFCAGVRHAQHVRDSLIRQGIRAACVTGETPKGERSEILAAFKEGRIQAVTNANVLTTGFDAPSIDLIAMLRPTLSVSLYVQMAGRGMRVAPGKADCLVLDFAGVVSMHGPITDVDPGGRSGDGEGEAMIPAKECESCHELCAVACRICPACGAAFPEPQRPRLELDEEADIMGSVSVTEAEIVEWAWRKHTSKASGKDMLAVTYYTGDLMAHGVTEYFPVLHDGYAQSKALAALRTICTSSGAAFSIEETGLEEAARILSISKPPSTIRYKRDGKFYRVLSREWRQREAKAS